MLPHVEGPPGWMSMWDPEMGMCCPMLSGYVVDLLWGAASIWRHD